MVGHIAIRFNQIKRPSGGEIAQTVVYFKIDFAKIIFGNQVNRETTSISKVYQIS